ncbi:MAG TPA: hypothetical protein VJ346_06415 [Bacteroidales bacterium]|nr:hypothetical protein [Bacteroidales bacterium]
MSRKGLIIILAIFLAVFGAILIYLWVFKKTDLSVNLKKADFKISAGELLQSFENDEESANTTFVNKVIIVTGLVDDVSEDSSIITVYLKDKDAISGVLCSFDKSVMSVNKISKGKEISIKGICSGYLLDVVLNKCSLME